MRQRTKVTLAAVTLAAALYIGAIAHGHGRGYPFVRLETFDQAATLQWDIINPVTLELGYCFYGDGLDVWFQIWRAYG